MFVTNRFFFRFYHRTMALTPTIPLYYASSTQLECSSTVLNVTEAKDFKEPNCHVVILDETVCYPQGGGQPSDSGVIEKNAESSFQILDCRTNRETNCIQHTGRFSGEQFSVGDKVSYGFFQQD